MKQMMLVLVGPLLVSDGVMDRPKVALNFSSIKWIVVISSIHASPIVVFAQRHIDTRAANVLDIQWLNDNLTLLEGGLNL